MEVYELNKEDTMKPIYPFRKPEPGGPSPKFWPTGGGGNSAFGPYEI